LIRTHFTPLLTVPLLVAVSGNLVAVLANQQLYAQIRTDLCDAVWNQAFADAEALARNGHRDDLALRREARRVVEAEIAARTVVSTVTTAMPHLSIAPASNSVNRASGDK
jgi:hypothetical protein